MDFFRNPAGGKTKEFPRGYGSKKIAFTKVAMMS